MIKFVAKWFFTCSKYQQYMWLSEALVSADQLALLVNMKNPDFETKMSFGSKWWIVVLCCTTPT